MSAPAPVFNETTPQLPQAQRGLPRRAFWVVRDSWSIAKRSLRHFFRQPRFVIFSTIQPVMFIVLFTFVFGGIAQSSLDPGVTYISFLLPGILVHSAAFRSTQTAVGIAEDLERGVIDRFRSLPIARGSILAGRTLADLVRSLMVILLMLIAGYALGFRFTQGFFSALAAVAVVGLFGYLFSWLFVWLALLVPGSEAVQTAGFVLVFPLVFASSIFVPLDTMPGWLSAFASVSPLTHATDAARAFAIGGDPSTALLWMGGWTAVAFLTVIPDSIRRFRGLT
jgi:ABC-2 type transport system permease protein/oleandomycin transport system permease protein